MRHGSDEVHLSWCISLPPTSYCDNPPPPAPHTARSPLTCHRCRCRSCGAYHPASSSSAQRGCRGRKTRQDGVMRACSPQCKFSGISVYLQGGLRFPAWDCEDCSLELRVATVTEVSVEGSKARAAHPFQCHGAAQPPKAHQEDRPGPVGRQAGAGATHFCRARGSISLRFLHPVATTCPTVRC